MILCAFNSTEGFPTPHKPPYPLPHHPLTYSAYIYPPHLTPPIRLILTSSLFGLYLPSFLSALLCSSVCSSKSNDKCVHLLLDGLTSRARATHLSSSFSKWPWAPDTIKHDVSEFPYRIGSVSSKICVEFCISAWVVDTAELC